MAEYIEREPLLEAFDNADADVYEDYDGTVDWGFGRKNIRDVINGIPTADVAPVTPGRWLNYDELYALAEQEFMSGALEHEEYDAIINFIDAAPVVESVSIGRRAWIPVKERLPEDRDDVLVVAFWAECWGVYMGWCVAEKNRWYVSTGSTCGPKTRRVPVAYWMPLPRLPDMESGGDADA